MRRLLPLSIVVLLVLQLALSGVLVATAVQPGNGVFQTTWARTDEPVLTGQANRTWMWGPEANSALLQESYAESPGGQRVVQYYDKARMEITDPNGDATSIWHVTNGLLVVELVTGQLQTGDASFSPLAPAGVNVAGDADDPNGPTYASFGGLLDQPPHGVGATVTQRIDRAGVVTDDPALASQGVTVALVDDVTNHGIAAPFWTFMTSEGLVFEGGQHVTAALFANPYFATGRPLAEPVWAAVKVAGSQRDVLIQCFERRCLTYTSGNSDGFLVEAGNVGQHYYQWRYTETGTAPIPVPSTAPTEEVTFSEELAAQVIAELDDTLENVNLFNSGVNGNPGVYPDGSPMVPSAGPELTDEQARAELASDFASDEALKAEVLDLYDDPVIALRIPAPALRAAFVAVLGYPGGTAVIDSFLGSNFTSIDFGGLLTAGAIAESIQYPSENHAKIAFNPLYRYEDFRQFISYMLHENLHSDVEVSGTEEAICNAVQAILYLQVIRRYPRLALQNTELTRRQNTLALAFLHSRQPGEYRTTLIAPDGAGVYPGSPNFSFPDFASLYADQASTPGSPLLVSILQELVEEGVVVQPNIGFNLNTIQFFDEYHDFSQVGLGYAEILRLGVLFQWYSVDEIAAASGKTPDAVISELALEPILQAIEASQSG